MQLTSEHFERTYAGKVQGAMNFRGALDMSALDFLVLFSSISSTFGIARQGSYAAENATLDALAGYWRGFDEPVWSVQWGPWREVGMLANSGGADRVIKVWDLTTMDQIATLAGHRSFVTALQVAKGDNILYSASSDKTLCEWDLQTYERRRVLTGHKGGLYSLAVHHGRACSGSLDATIRVWDP